MFFQIMMVKMILKRIVIQHEFFIEIFLITYFAVILHSNLFSFDLLLLLNPNFG